MGWDDQEIMPRDIDVCSNEVKLIGEGEEGDK